MSPCPPSGLQDIGVVMMSIMRGWLFLLDFMWERELRSHALPITRALM